MITTELAREFALFRSIQDSGEFNDLSIQWILGN